MMLKSQTREKWAKIASYSTFWGWNVSFLAIVSLGVMPWFVEWVPIAIEQGGIALDCLISLSILILVPTVSTIVAVTKLKGKPDVQIRLFYGVEAPLFLLGLTRLFLLRELTLASAFLLCSVIAAALIYGYFLLPSIMQTSEFSANKRDKNTRVELPLSALLLIISLYIGAILTIYAIPWGWNILTFVIDFDWLEFLYNLFFSSELLGLLWWLPFAALFLLFTSTLFVFTPIALVRFYSAMWWRKIQQVSWYYATLTSLAVATVWIGSFVLLDNQPQQQVFAWLKQQESASASERKNFVLNHQDTIKHGLVNAYLYAYRYVSVKHLVNSPSETYKDAFGSAYNSNDFLWVDSIYTTLLSPLLYQGEKGDDKKAAKLYAQMFDAPIQTAEKESIITALLATADGGTMAAGLIDVNQHQVLITKQSITTTEQQYSTNVEIYEQYTNQTHDQQEIFYYFTLPSNSVITGLWLGESEDKSEAIPSIIAPRGAAQKVYKQQVRRSIDPALLEQVGPLQYRLRVFPIPAKRFAYQSSKEQAVMHLWLSYSTLNQQEITLLPHLLEKRNVYWSQESERSVNGQSFSAENAEDNAHWMPDLIYQGNNLISDNKSDSKPITLGSVGLAPTLNSDSTNSSVRSYPITAKILDKKPESKEAYFKGPYFKGHKHIKVAAAVLVDGSYSMRNMQDKVAKAIDDLQHRADTLDIFALPSNQELTRVNGIEDIGYYGVLTDSDLWNQAAALSASGFYDLVIVLTDQGSYQLAEDKPNLISSVGSDIWFVHLDQLAPAYQDSVMGKLLVHGGIASSIEQAWQQYLLNRSLAIFQQNDNGVLWDFGACYPNPDSITIDIEQPIIAAKLIQHLAQCQKQNNNLAFLDTLHSIAKKHRIVSPYSSMIVLVNQQQEEALNKAEQESDRFKRSVETGEETLSKPADLLVSGVPEPEEWLLIIVGGVLLLYLARKKKLNRQTAI